MPGTFSDAIRRSSIANNVLPEVRQPGHQVGHLVAHGFGGQMDALTVAGQYPLELIVQQAGERLLLLGPGVPAVVAKGGELAAVAVPGEMVAGAEIAVFVE